MSRFGRFFPSIVGLVGLYAACATHVSGSATSTGANDAGSGGGDAGAPNGPTFPCDKMFCAVATQYCLDDYADTGQGGSYMIEFGYTCQPIPPECLPAPTCDCIHAHADVYTCWQDPRDGSFNGTRREP